MIRFFLLTRGRTGSTAVIDELNKTGILCATQELFLKYKWDIENSSPNNWDPKNSSPKKGFTYELLPPYELWKFWKSGAWWKKLLLLLRQEKALAAKYFDEAEDRAQLRNAQGFGFKVLSNNFDERPFLLDILTQRNYKMLYLTRNLAHQVLSGMIANQRGIYNSLEEVNDIHRYSIDLKEFEDRVNWEKQCVENDYALLKKQEHNFLIVSYEEFCEDKQSFFSKVFNFLELPIIIPDPSDYTVVIKDPAYTIENYADVVRCAETLGYSLE